MSGTVPSPDAAPIALIGGGGALPAALVAALDRQGRDVRLCEMREFPFDGLNGRPRHAFRLETLAELLDDLQSAGIEEVCFAGAIRRPDLDPAEVTAASAPLVTRLAQAMTLGDDGALRTVIHIFEEAGLRVVGADTIAPGLLPRAGRLTVTGLYAGAESDLDAARVAHADLAARDAGQAVVVREGRVLATEGPDGTDAMLGSLIGPNDEAAMESDGVVWTPGAVADAGTWIADWLRSRTDAPGVSVGMLYKAPKPGQDRRVDLPVIGPATVMRAAEAGLAAIVIEAGGVIVLDAEQVAAVADGSGIAIVVVPRGETVGTLT